MFLLQTLLAYFELHGSHLKGRRLVIQTGIGIHSKPRSKKAVRKEMKRLTKAGLFKAAGWGFALQEL